jgi:putative transposase
VRLVISDAHAGLKAAIARVLQGAAWQRCRVHLMRNLLATVPKGQAEMVAALVRTIFAQTNAETTRAQLREVVADLETPLRQGRRAARSRPSTTSPPTRLPPGHWRKIWSTNPLERVNKEIKRRTNVVGVFPNDDAVIRLVGAVLGRGPRRLASRRPPLPVRGLHGPAQPPPTEEIDTTDTHELPAA